MTASNDQQLLRLPPPTWGLRGLAAAGACMLACLAAALPAEAQRIDNTMAVFAALDKVTARISRLEVKLNETVKFGTLKITPRACFSRAPTEPPKTTTFVEVFEEPREGEGKKIFSGWMFAESPGLSAVEHPVFDLWLTDCAGPRTAGPAIQTQPAPRPGTAQPKAGPGAGPPQPGALPPADDFRRRRPPR
jgi:hypothetical protein